MLDECIGQSHTGHCGMVAIVGHKLKHSTAESTYDSAILQGDDTLVVAHAGIRFFTVAVLRHIKCEDNEKERIITRSKKVFAHTTKIICKTETKTPFLSQDCCFFRTFEKNLKDRESRQ